MYKDHPPAGEGQNGGRNNISELSFPPPALPAGRGVFIQAPAITFVLNGLYTLNADKCKNILEKEMLHFQERIGIQIITDSKACQRKVIADRVLGGNFSECLRDFQSGFHVGTTSTGKAKLSTKPIHVNIQGYD